ncbi:MAG: hypothetical protein AUJ57_03105 [Zetaproteobacteria bacterium CG1_02_53_45]|nr:MAG: hypothetical protein AUJ57_03105 [Zetaproteobacteria bacterium CG1_02_53_45]
MSAIELLYRTAIDFAATNTLIINAHAHPLLNELCAQTHTCTLQQHFKPEYNAVKSSGLAVSSILPDSGTYDLVLLLPAKNKLQTLAWMASAMEKLEDHGRLLVACANSHGARSYETALQKLAGNVSSTSKSKCRLFSARKTDAVNRELATAWLEGGQAQAIESLGLMSQAGLFSWDRADPGSLLLLQQLPDLSGIGMDLCCGYGLLSHQILADSPAVQIVHMIEADYFAIACAGENTKKWQQKVQLHWADATSDELPTQLDWIVCNPPFHSGQARDIDLGQAIVRRACRSLKKGGTLYLVANRQLPYEHVLQAELHTCRKLTEANGFKVMQGIRS